MKDTLCIGGGHSHHQFGVNLVGFHAILFTVYGDETEAIDNTSYLAKDLYTMVGKGAGHGHCNVNTSNSRPDLITFLLHLLSQQTG